MKLLAVAVRLLTSSRTIPVIVALAEVTTEAIRCAEATDPDVTPANVTRPLPIGPGISVRCAVSLDRDSIRWRIVGATLPDLWRALA